MGAVEGDDVRVFHACAAENIERGTNRQIDAAAAQARHVFKVRQRFRAAGIGRGNGTPL